MNGSQPSDNYADDSDATGTAVDGPRVQKFCESCVTWHDEDDTKRCSCGTSTCLTCLDANDNRCPAEFCDAAADVYDRND